MNFIKNLIEKEKTKNNEIYEKKSYIYGSLFFSGISLILTILNVIMKYKEMAYGTTFLFVGFIIAYLCAIKNRTRAFNIVLSVMCMIIFSAFALTGGNDGFAILWIILVPIISFLLLGMVRGFLLSLYFQLLLIIMFYTPIFEFAKIYYTDTFVMRFPILYFAMFGAISFLMYQRQKLYDSIEKQSFYDSLSGLHNRRYFNELCKKLDSKKQEGLAVFSFDINSLKKANDNIGHGAGDELIREVGRLISEVFSKDECCRIGGDEFVVISTREDSLTSEAVIKAKFEKWQGGIVPKMSVSIGYASSIEVPDISVEELVRRADMRMYSNKSEYYKNLGAV